MVEGLEADAEVAVVGEAMKQDELVEEHRTECEAPRPGAATDEAWP